MTHTMVDITPAERDACVGRWAEVRHRLVIIAEIHERIGDAHVFRVETSTSEWHPLPDITPRFDLPRAWTPSGEPVPGEWEDSPSTPGVHRWCARWEQRPDEVTP